MNTLPLIVPVTSSPLPVITKDEAGCGQVSASAPSFSQYLKEALGQVSNLEAKAQEQTTKLVLGEAEDLHQVLIAGEKASLALQLTIQVRNKVLEAYQEIMRMNI